MTDAHSGWWVGHRDTPVPVEIDVCPVCTQAVFDDPRHERVDHTSAVRMPDGYWTHAGCEADYPAVAAVLEAADGVASVEYEDPLRRTA